MDEYVLYEQKEETLPNLKWMCETAIENIEKYPIDKLSRWLGFVQGVLTCRGIIIVQEERDYSRPLFHQAYVNEKIEVPPTRSMNDEC